MTPSLATVALPLRQQQVAVQAVKENVGTLREVHFLFFDRASFNVCVAAAEGCKLAAGGLLGVAELEVRECECGVSTGGELPVTTSRSTRVYAVMCFHVLFYTARGADNHRLVEPQHYTAVSLQHSVP